MSFEEEIEQEKRLDNYIKRLTELTGSIKRIYDKLGDVATNEKESQKLEEALEIAISIENQLYYEIGDNILFDDAFIRRVVYLLKRSHLTEKEAIENRIINYAAQKHFLNPFLSEAPTKEEREEDNKLYIQSQVNMEYTRNLLININKELSKTTNESDIIKLTRAKNKLLFCNKMISKLINDENYCQSDARTRCIVFNHNEEVVNLIFGQFVQNISNYCINNILINENSLFDQLELKSSLAILTNSELMRAAQSYQKITKVDPYFKALIENNPKNHEIITTIIESFLKKTSSVTKK